jgi:DNA-binding MarR family transcriptional regulator
MDKLLLEFVNTLHQSLQKIQLQVGNHPKFTRLTIHQLQYIDTIHNLGDPNITDLANQLGITKASVTAGVNKLVALGYATKTQSSHDRRSFHVQLTQAGEELVATKNQALTNYGQFIRAALSEQEVKQFEEILVKLIHLFEESIHPQ